MMIKIYDKSLTPLCVLTKCDSIQWTKRFSDVGSFEFHLKPNDENLKYIKEDYYISHNGTFGIILYAEQTATDVKICGYDLKGILKYRKCEGAKSGVAETVIKSYISDNVINPTDTNRKITNFVNATDQVRGITVNIENKLELLDVKVNNICTTSNLGYDVTLSNGIFTFDVLQGTDSTKSQTVVPPVMFCKQFKNISDYEYIKDSLTSYNTVYVGTNLIYNTLYTGMDRKEGCEEFDGTAGEAQTKGKTLLTENAVKESITAETNHRLKYNTDWFLGDYVTVRVDVMGETLLLDKQITEVLEVYERGNVSVKPTFGEVKNSVIKRLMRR